MTLPNDDKNVLRSFLDQARHLETHSLIEGRQLRAKWNLTMTRGEEAREETHRVDYEALESMLVRLRLFAMNDEAVFVPRVVNILKPHFPENIKYLRSITDLFLIKKEYRMLKVKADGQEFSEEELFNDFINSRVFHQDADSRERLAVLGNLKEDGFAYTILLSAIVTKVNAVRRLRLFIERHVELG